MRVADAFHKTTPRYAGLWTVWAALLLLPGSTLVGRSHAQPKEPADAAAVEQKLAEVERSCAEADLTAEETKAAVALAKRVKADKYELCKLAACGKLNAVEKRAFDKLIGRFGHPLTNELAKLREVAAEAKLTAEETAAAEKIALQEGFNNDALVRRYEGGKLSPVEKAAFEKVIAVKGHPRAKELEQLTDVARLAGLPEAELKTLRGLAARADWDIEKVKAWKRANQLSEAEAAALAKLQPFASQLPSRPERGEPERVRGFRQAGKVAGLTDAETTALLEAIQVAGGDEQGLLEAKRANKLSAPAAAGLKKLESLLGKTEDLVASPYKKEIGKLLETAAAAGLSTEETGVLMKLAAKAKYDREAVRKLKDSGRLSDAEVRVVEKIIASQNR
jgi:hypothetical protein